MINRARENVISIRELARSGRSRLSSKQSSPDRKEGAGSGLSLGV